MKISNVSKYNQDWDTLVLNDLGIFKRGKSKHRPRNDIKLFENGKIPLIQTGDVKAANLYLKSHSKTYNEFGLEQSKLWDKGTLCITIAANIADTSILTYPMCFPDSVVGFNANKKTSEYFMHYIFSFIQKSIKNTVSGSIQDNINIDILSNLNFKIPNIIIQNKILDTLLTIDNKIELNNKINKELEEMAKDLYNFWFVQFDFPDENGKPYKSSGGKMVYNDELKREIPDGWEILLLNDYLNFEKGIEPGTKNYFEINNENDLVTFSKVGDMNSNSSLWIKLNIAGESISNLGDILVSFDGTVGKIDIRMQGSFSSGIRKITDEKGFFPKSYIYNLFQSYEIQKIISKNSTGSNIQHASSAIEVLYCVYNKKIVELYSNITNSSFKKIVENKIENQELIQLRDFLLPLLMNGQVKVK